MPSNILIRFPSFVEYGVSSPEKVLQKVSIVSFPINHITTNVSTLLNMSRSAAHNSPIDIPMMVGKIVQMCHQTLRICCFAKKNELNSEHFGYVCPFCFKFLRKTSNYSV
jgi:hypothetical protein